VFQLDESTRAFYFRAGFDQALAVHVIFGLHDDFALMFARSALTQSINPDDTTLPAWFEAAAAISPLRLHRPS
jgi:hypothetical protein